MFKYILIGFISALFVLPCDVYSQMPSKDKTVLSPYADKKGMASNSVIIRKYMPFDDKTFFTTIFGAVVYRDENMQINMFPLAVSNGEIETANPNNTTLGMQFTSHSRSEGSKTDSFEPVGITFLIDGDRYKNKVVDEATFFVEDHSIFVDLIKADKVRARLEGEKNYYEIDMSREIRNVLKKLLTNITDTSK